MRNAAKNLACWLAAACGFAAGPVCAGAWVPEEAQVYNKFALNYLQSNGYFGVAPPGLRRFTDSNFTYYFEAGIGGQTALFGSVPLQRLTRSDNAGVTENVAVGDIAIGIRRQLSDGPWVSAAALAVKLPGFYDKDGPLPAGNGQLDLEWRFLVGRSLGIFGYAGAEVAYRYRTEAPADEFRYLLEYGFATPWALYFRTKYDAIKGVGNSDGAGAPAPGNPALNLEFDLSRIEATLGLQLARAWALEAQWTPSLDGDNTLRSNAYQLAVIWQP